MLIYHNSYIMRNEQVQLWRGPDLHMCLCEKTSCVFGSGWRGLWAPLRDHQGSWWPRPDPCGFSHLPACICLAARSNTWGKGTREPQVVWARMDRHDGPHPKLSHLICSLMGLELTQSMTGLFPVIFSPCLRRSTSHSAPNFPAKTHQDEEQFPKVLLWHRAHSELALRPRTEHAHLFVSFVFVRVCASVEGMSLEGCN